MKIKPILAELYKNLDLPLDEYRALPESQILYTNIDVLSQFESYHLPEITKVICANESILGIAAFEQYRVIRNIYVSQDDTTYIQLLSQINPDEIIHNILPLADESILKKFYSFCDSWLNKRNILSQEITDCESKIEFLEQKMENDREKLAQKESELLKSDSNTDEKKHNSSIKGIITKTKNQIEKDQIEYNNINYDLDAKRDNIKSINAILERNIKVFEAIKTILDDYVSAVGVRRDKAYKIITDSPAKKLIDCVITGNATLEQRKKLKDELFCISMISEFSSYDAVTVIDVVTKLYDMGDIDINEGVFKSYLINHIEDVCQYMVFKYDSVAPKQDESYEAWIEYIIDVLLEFGYIPQLSIYMNSIKNDETWHYILDSISSNRPDLALELLCTLCLHVEGTSGKIILTFLKSMIASGDIFGNTVSEFIITLISKDCGTKCKQIVREVIKHYESELKSAKRKINVAEHENADRPAEVFRSMYESVENLELLTTNFASSHNRISPDVLKNNLLKAVIQIRMSMVNLEVYPAASDNDWFLQTDIDYSIEKHECNNLVEGDKVKLRTMGFKYQDANGEWKIIPAKVIKTSKKVKLSSKKQTDKSKPHTEYKCVRHKDNSKKKKQPYKKDDKK